MQETVMGMVLSASPMGEYDKRLTILTRERGKISAFAKGARRPRSPLLACTEPFTFGTFDIYVGRSSYTVSSAEVQNYFQEMRDDLEDICYGNYFCEMASYFTKENMECSMVLKLLYQSLRALKVPSIPHELVRCIYEMKMIALDGEAPRVFECMQCGTHEKLAWFLSEEAGVLCADCAGHSKGIPISETTAYTLQRILSDSIEKLYTYTVSESIIAELKKVCKQYLKDHVDTTFHSLDMIEQMPKLQMQKKVEK